ncbi:MAG: zinc ribbon domain-containing protein [Methylococcaceae bacterium]|nr:zinc ribbon domain-containing protein [Methylococcaceae bacterium]
MVESLSSNAISCRKAVQSLIAIVMILIVGKVVVSIPLFSNTEIFASLTSAKLVNFVTTMAILAFVFIFTKHTLNALEGTGHGVSFLRGITIPVASLIIVTVAQNSVRELLNPFVGDTGNTLLTLFSSLVVFVAAVWVVFAGYQHSLLLFDWFISVGRLIRARFANYPSGRICPNCAASADALAKFCPDCGTGFETRYCNNCHTELSSAGKYCGQCGCITEG